MAPDAVPGEPVSTRRSKPWRTASRAEETQVAVEMGSWRVGPRSVPSLWLVLCLASHGPCGTHCEHAQVVVPIFSPFGAGRAELGLVSAWWRRQNAAEIHASENQSSPTRRLIILFSHNPLLSRVQRRLLLTASQIACLLPSPAVIACACRVSCNYPPVKL